MQAFENILIKKENMNINMNEKNPLCSTELKGGTGEFTTTQEELGKSTVKLKQKKNYKSTNHNNETCDRFFNKIQQ